MANDASGVSTAAKWLLLVALTAALVHASQAATTSDAALISQWGTENGKCRGALDPNLKPPETIVPLGIASSSSSALADGATANHGNTARQAAMRSGDGKRGSGRVRRHSAIRRAQRGAKLHPCGRRRGPGGLPGGSRQCRGHPAGRARSRRGASLCRDAPARSTPVPPARSRRCVRHHDRDRVGALGGDAEVMGDKDHTHAELVAGGACSAIVSSGSGRAAMSVMAAVHWLRSAAPGPRIDQ